MVCARTGGQMMRRPDGAFPVTMWRGPKFSFARAVGWMTLASDRLEWRPVMPTPFFPQLEIPIADIRSVRIGGLLFGPDLRVATAERTYRFTVLRTQKVRDWCAQVGLPTH